MCHTCCQPPHGRREKEVEDGLVGAVHVYDFRHVKTCHAKCGPITLVEGSVFGRTSSAYNFANFPRTKSYVFHFKNAVHARTASYQLSYHEFISIFFGFLFCLWLFGWQVTGGKIAPTHRDAHEMCGFSLCNAMHACGKWKICAILGFRIAYAIRNHPKRKKRKKITRNATPFVVGAEK